ncbi:paxillin-like isoform X2 [Xiphias gladius]|uniref:paxillin-like isoform X2 n=1 Tax=Xiphias gladius TaxID=8245 RepID=UPI001A99201F|nr:paxillin-like isoform X2 [Xiphias gladius]
MTSALGSNLSELDRLLLELNAVQQSSPSFPTTEEAAPPLPSCSITHYENGGSPDIMVSPPSQEKPKRNGTRVDETRPTVESLLDELEGSVPSPSPPACHSDLDAPPQQQARMSASCATRELDELMASLSDFKPSSLGSLLDPAGASSSSPHPQVSSSVTPVASPFLSLSHMSTCASPLFSLPAGLELHIDEDGGDRGMSMPHSNRLPPHSPISSLSAASDLDLDSVIDVSATMLSSQTKSLLVLSQSASSNSNLIGNSPSPSNTTTTPSLTSVNTVLDHKSSKCPSPSLERASPSDTIGKFSCAPEIMSKGSASFPELDLNLSTPPPSINFTPYLSVPKTPSPLPVAVSISPPFTHASSKTSSPSLVSPLTVPSPPAFTSPSRQPLELASTAVQQPPMVEPSLDEALDKLLAMSFAQNPSTTHVEEAQLKMDAQCLGTGMREVLEELILPMDRNSVQPDTFTSATNTITDDSVDGGTDGNGDLDWADEELSVSLHDGLDGTMTPYTERPYTDGSMTPLTEASWMDESMTPSTCPGTPDVALDLPMLQTPSIDRVSASGHIKSVIRRTKETPNVHPMYRDGHLRRKMGPVIVNKNSSQDRLIEELQGKLGIGRSERRRKQSDDWMTEGVIVTSKPQRFRPDGADSEVDKIIIPPESPVPVRKVPPPLSPPAPRRPPTVEETKRPLPIMAQGKGGVPGGPPTQVNKLDNMLGSLQSDLNKLGVQTVAKGVCGACCKPIVGQVVTAMGRTWHPEHFVCTHCQEEIGSRNFFEREGQPYCEKDYHNLFSPRCYYCNGPILDKVVTALDRTWHPEHFFCAQCGSFFGPEGFHEKDGKAYCRNDYFDMFAPKCGGCARAILENYISALNCLWHPECFVCRECFTPFVNGSFFEHDGQPYCEVHYHERRGSLCSGCQKPITGRCITAMSKKFHPEHFVCAFCLKQLNKGTFKEQNDKPYCHGCFIKLFS